MTTRRHTARLERADELVKALTGEGEAVELREDGSLGAPSEPGPPDEIREEGGWFEGGMAPEDWGIMLPDLEQFPPEILRRLKMILNPKVMRDEHDYRRARTRIITMLSQHPSDLYEVFANALIHHWLNNSLTGDLGEWWGRKPRRQER